MFEANPRAAMSAPTQEYLAAFLQRRTGLHSQGGADCEPETYALQSSPGTTLKGKILMIRRQLWLYAPVDTTKDVSLNGVMNESNSVIVCADTSHTVEGYALLRNVLQQDPKGVETEVLEFGVRRSGENISAKGIEQLAASIIRLSTEMQTSLHGLLGQRKHLALPVGTPRIVFPENDCVPRSKIEKFHKQISGFAQVLREFPQGNLGDNMTRLSHVLSALQEGYSGHVLVEALAGLEDIQKLTHPPISFDGDTSHEKYIQRLGAFWTQVLDGLVRAIDSLQHHTLFSDQYLATLVNSDPQNVQQKRVVHLRKKSGDREIGNLMIIPPSSTTMTPQFQFTIYQDAPNDTLSLLSAYALRNTVQTEWYRNRKANRFQE